MKIGAVQDDIVRCEDKPRYFIRFFIACTLLFSFRSVQSADLRWDGEGNDGLWSNPANWSSNALPASEDNVVLDNSITSGSYTVVLGGGAGSISVRSIRITPASANTITFQLPLSNVETPALSCRGTIYGLVLDRGAVLINESGAASGLTLDIGDSIRINNGAKYIHRTPRSHAETIRSLSRAPGTEEGEFEFSIPVASSTISLSGQVFGRLRLSPGINDLINYTGTGTNSVNIRSDLEIMPGVNLSLNLEGSLSVGRDLIQNGGTFNLASTARNIKLEIGGDLNQSAGAVITESGSANPEILLKGSRPQALGLQGTISNDVALKIDNADGINLTSNTSLSYKLILDNGAIATGQYLLSLEPACLLQVSEKSTCYIKGRLEKKGLNNASYFFPVGDGGARRWLQIHEATGNFLVEYLRSDPRQVSTSVGPGISHISSIEHWKITHHGATGSASIELSFDNVNSGGITDLQHLRVAAFNENAWNDAGNSATTGLAGGAGSVKSQLIQWSAAQSRLFSLASSSATQNPLPVGFENLRAIIVGKEVRLEWKHEVNEPGQFLIQRSSDGLNYQFIHLVEANPGSRLYTYVDPTLFTGPRYYRITLMNKDSSGKSSRIVRVGQDLPNALVPTVYLTTQNIRIAKANSSDNQYSLEIFELNGRLVLRRAGLSGGELINLALPTRLTTGQLVFVRVRYKAGHVFTLKTLVH